MVARALDGWWIEAGRPEVFEVVEVGAGPGSLARSVRAARPACAAALRLVLVEVSASQRAVHPVDDLSVVSRSTVPDGPGPRVVLANELLDNLPFGLLERTADGWAEVRIGVEGDELVEVLGASGEAPLGDAAIGVRVPLQGEVRTTPHGPGRFWHYRMGGAFGLLIKTPGVTIYHNGSADLIDAELDGEHADVLLAGLAGRKGTENYVGRLIGALQPKLVVPTHHDAFFAPLERGLHLLPGIDVEGFVSEVYRRAPGACVITQDYEEPICVPPHDARGSVLAAG